MYNLIWFRTVWRKFEFYDFTILSVSAPNLDSFKAIVRRTTLKSYRLCSLPVSFSRFTWNFLKPSVDAPPRSPTDDTEFSAQHARRVIGSGVVLERKASISAGPVPELKNKVHSACSNELSFTNPGMEVRIPLYCVFGLGCVEVEVFVFKKLVSLRLACFFGGGSLNFRRKMLRQRSRREQYRSVLASYRRSKKL